MTKKRAKNVIQGRSESRIKEMRLCKSTGDMGSKGNWALALHPVSSVSHREARYIFCRNKREKMGRKLKEKLGSYKFFVFILIIVAQVVLILWGRG